MRRPRLRVVLAWLAATTLPLLVCLAFTWAMSLQHYREAAASLAEANAERIADILRDGERLLTTMAEATGGECTPANIAIMSRAVFHSLHFREAGIERAGDLICTSLEMLPPGFDIPNATRTPAARVGRMEILSPAKTIRGGRSIILNLPLDAERSRFINLLLAPRELAESVARYEGLDATTLLDDRPNGRLIVLDGAAPDLVDELASPLAPGIHRHGGGYYAVARAGEYPVYTVMSVSAARVADHWRAQLWPALAAGFLFSLLAFLVLRRALPQRNAIDDLREGIAAGELIVEYQPIHDARDRRVIGAEALVRWAHPQRGRVMPDEFIPLAELCGAIVPLTDAVITQVRDDLALLGELPPGFRISINVARAQFTDAGLLAVIDERFGAGASLDRLGFEVTERELLANVAEQARDLALALGRRGAEVSLDDFGTGYSGLTHLRQLRPHHIKIDRSFTWALDSDAVTADLVGSIVTLADNLSIGVIAEGVETEQQRERLLALGVHRHQGWLYSKALDLAALKAKIAATG